MRTGRSLTICLTLLRGGGGYPQRKQKSKKNPLPKLGGPLTPPQKLETPRKIGDPPKNWRTPPPQDWPARHAGIPTPPVDRHTLVKILPWPNFVAAGNKRRAPHTRTFTFTHPGWCGVSIRQECRTVDHSVYVPYHTECPDKKHHGLCKIYDGVKHVQIDT